MTTQIVQGNPEHEILVLANPQSVSVRLWVARPYLRLLYPSAA